MKDSTKCVWGAESLEHLGSVSMPIYQTANFGFKDTEEVLKAVRGEEGKYLYTRWDNPTVKLAEKKIALLEEGEDSLLFSSGMAAIICSALAFLSKGDKALAFRELYGEAINFFKNILPKFGIEVSFVKDYEELERELNKRTKLIYFETPTNPTLKVIDIAKVKALAEKYKTLVFVDNTFATPINQKPLKLGADLVIHSASKYLNGHSDLIAGAIVGRNELIGKIKAMRRVLGCVLDPFGAWLLIRGIKTLDIRVERHNKNALELAKYLEKQSKVNKVYYPGLPTNEYYELSKKQMKGFGGMLSFELKGGYKEAKGFVERLRFRILGASLGGVETIITHPASTSHSMLSKEEREILGIKDGLIRVSLGIEDVEDIIEDFDKAFNYL